MFDVSGVSESIFDFVSAQATFLTKLSTGFGDSLEQIPYTVGVCR
jgi:hypothetical protein